MDKIKVVCPHCGQVNAIPFKESYNRANCGGCKSSLLDTKPIQLEASTFDHHLVNSDIPVVVDFWAPWCGPCRMMAPAFEEAAQAFALKARFAKLNTEEHQEPSARFGIRSIPTMIIFKNGKELDRVSGALSSDQIRQWVGRFI
jgi:thioredoxin 2